MNYIQNPDGYLSRNLRTLKEAHASRILGILRGGFMRCDHRELWNLVDLVQTNFLGDWQEFHTTVAQPILLGRYVLEAYHNNCDTNSNMFRSHLPVNVKYTTSRQRLADEDAIQRSVAESQALKERLLEIMIERRVR